MPKLPVIACLVFALAPLFVAAPAGGGEPRGAELLAPFKQDLKAALVAGLAEGVPEAIDACRVQAPAIVARLEQDGVRLGRTSHRLRNPANTAPEWVAPILAAWVEDARNAAPHTVTLEGQREGYVEPIALEAMCATCHGTSLAPEVQRAIDAAYPADRATGFEVGDLRGVFWVEYPAR